LQRLDLEVKGRNCFALGLHPNMGIVLQHFSAYMSRNCHESLFRNTGFSQAGDAVMSKIMKSQSMC
jgi:hypothetical protein